ncbi:MAG: ethanolamine utilization protein EutH [Flexilinea sp.]|nr:ethanolamine utilization protein EutH [Flexilinea sp.]
MNVVISWILAIFAVIGGLDYLFGNKLGLGSKFERALSLMGPMATSITGVIVMVPILSWALQHSIVPLFSMIGFDPGVFGGLIPIDWGGFFLAKDLAIDPRMGLFGGVNVAGTFGTALSFAVPMGMRVLKEKKKQDAFARGILEGLVILPVSLILGGLAAGLGLGEILWHSLPILILSGLVLFGIWKNLPLMVRIFTVFSQILRAIGIIGITVGAFQQMAGVTLIPGITPILDAMRIIAMITVTMLGCLPLSEFLTRILRKPLESLAKKVRTSPEALSDPIMTVASGTAGIIAMQDFDERGIELNAAFVVYAVSALSAQLSFILNNAPDYMASYMVTKFAGAFLALTFSVWMMNRRENKK